jgi:hypothetical protein
LGSFGGYYKGEKKKQKKDKLTKKTFGDVSAFTLPEIITKKKDR